MSEETTQPSTESVESQTEATVTDGGETVSETSYLDGKYKSVGDLESGYKELQSSYSKKLGAFTGAPEAYELAEGIELNAQIERLQEWGAEKQLSNEALNELISMDRSYQEEAQNAYIAEQREALGKDADVRINNLNDWTRANFGDDGVEALNEVIGSAKGVEFMESMMKKMQGTAPAPTQAAQKVDEDTIKQMQFAVDDYGNRKMNDPAYAAKVRAMRSQLQG